MNIKTQKIKHENLIGESLELAIREYKPQINRINDYIPALKQKVKYLGMLGYMDRDLFVYKDGKDIKFILGVIKEVKVGEVVLSSFGSAAPESYSLIDNGWMLDDEARAYCKKSLEAQN